MTERPSRFEEHFRNLPHRRPGGRGQRGGPAHSAAPKYILGDVGSQYDEGIALVDFLGRHRIGFYSAESSYFSGLTEAQVSELDALFGADFSRFGFWYYFSLNDGCGRTLSFPPMPQAPQTPPVRQRQVSRLVALIAGRFH